MQKYNSFFIEQRVQYSVFNFHWNILNNNNNNILNQNNVIVNVKFNKKKKIKFRNEVFIKCSRRFLWCYTVYAYFLWLNFRKTKLFILLNYRIFFIKSIQFVDTIWYVRYYSTNYGSYRILGINTLYLHNTRRYNN